MSLLALGLSHKTAPVPVRERLAFAGDGFDEALRDLRSQPGIDECAIVSTCNRSELYAVGDGLSIPALSGWMHDWHGAEPGRYDDHLVGRSDREAVAHLLRVTSGMESMILGEPQVVGQVKQAWQDAQRLGTLGVTLDRLFQHAFQTSKLVRSETGIGHNPVTLPFAALKLAHRIFGDAAGMRVLMIGAGEMIQDCARHFASQGVARLTIANRSTERARELAAELDAEASGLDDLDKQLPEHDIVVACTGSARALIDAPMVERALERRRRRPMFLLDLSVPRNIAAAVGDFEDAYLYTIDDLREIAEHGHRRRAEAQDAAEAIVSGQVEAFERWLNLHETSETLKGMRRRATRERDALVDEAVRQLAAGKDPEDVLRRFGHRLTNRLLHGPSIQLRLAAESGNEALLDAARRLLMDEGE